MSDPAPGRPEPRWRQATSGAPVRENPWTVSGITRRGLGLDLNDPRELDVLRSEVEQAVAALERVDLELAALQADLVSLGRHRRAILRERGEILHRLSSLRPAVSPALHPPPPPSRPLSTPIWVQASEAQAIVFGAGRTLRRLLGDID